MRLSSVTTRGSLLKVGLASIAVISLAVACVVIVVGLPGSGAGQVSIAYPFEGSTFPPEIIAPTVWWEDGNSKAGAWRVTVNFADDAEPVVASTDTNMWTPDPNTWENIKSHSRNEPARITVTSLQNLIVAKRTSRFGSHRDFARLGRRAHILSRRAAAVSVRAQKRTDD